MAGKKGFHIYLNEQEQDMVPPDGAGWVMMGTALKKNIAVVSPDDVWKIDQASDPQIVLAYMGEGHYWRTHVGE